MNPSGTENAYAAGIQSVALPSQGTRTLPGSHYGVRRRRAHGPIDPSAAATFQCNNRGPFAKRCRGFVCGLAKPSYAAVGDTALLPRRTCRGNAPAAGVIKGGIRADTLSLNPAVSGTA